ncbi:MAG: hypothetical protein Q7S45_00425 [Candidatus Curtissbacteria bacterium]|nr:hypothetical protein [Candidatus Curtissbacteria bacterium]
MRIITSILKLATVFIISSFEFFYIVLDILKINETIHFTSKDNGLGYFFSVLISPIAAIVSILLLGMFKNKWKHIFFLIILTSTTIILYLFTANFSKPLNEARIKIPKLEKRGCLTAYWPTYLPDGYKFNSLGYINNLNKCNQDYLYSFSFFNLKQLKEINVIHIRNLESKQSSCRFYASDGSLEETILINNNPSYILISNYTICIDLSKDGNRIIVEGEYLDQTVNPRSFTKSEGNVLKEEVVKVASGLEKFNAAIKNPVN